MFSSLRSRLWLSYALLAGVVLGLLLIGLALVLLRSPILERQALLRLDVIAAELTGRQEVLGEEAAEARIESALSRAAQALDVRLLLVSPEGQVQLDTGAPDDSPLRLLARQLRVPQGQVRDVNNTVWLYAHRTLPDGSMLVVTSPRPARIGLLQRAFGDETLLRPFFQAGLAALFVSLILSIGIARWVAAPLQRMSAAAQDVAERVRSGLPAGETSFPQVPAAGPEEVQQLAHSFNEMSHAVQDSQQALRDFVANVSHELKTPLTSIRGFSQALLDDTASSPEDRRRAAQVIDDEAGRMYRMVQDLLELARYDAGMVQLSMSSVNLTGLLEHGLDKFAMLAKSADLTLTLDCEAGLVVWGEGDRLMQVFNNLIDNAIRHTPAGGDIRITCRASGRLIQVAVSDTGPGILPSERNRIFERFYQVDKARAGGAAHGSGLGLAISREIVHMHGGTLALDEEYAQGSRFVVNLPTDRFAEAPRRSLFPA
jgi:two-component system OmpR family sensor kinase